MSSDALIRRVKKEIADCKSDKAANINIELIDNSPFHLRGSFHGPQDTPYEGGHFEVDIVIPDSYPFQPFKIKFITKVYHPNVSSASGAISIDILDDAWSPALTLSATLISVQSLLSSPNPNDPLDTEVAKHYITSRTSFEDTARYWTHVYAGGPVPACGTPPMVSMRVKFEKYILDLQDKIIKELEQLDPNAPPFFRDRWDRPEGGYGISSVFSLPFSPTPATTVLEKAGVNISVVHGKLPPAAVKQMRADHASLPYDPESQESLPFFAAGISLVIHPRNPHAPTVHANYRYFEVMKSSEPTEVLAWWFGGGSDLTPSYLYDDDARDFHTTLKTACDAHGTTLYPNFKTWCDEYFFIPHRGEARGIGGLFFDDLCDTPHKRLPDASPTDRPWTPDSIFAFVRAAGEAFIPSYMPILRRRAHAESTDEQRRWQLLRRGRYVEFNLVHDRGTKFGLMTPGARIESILMSLPETARWEYRSEVGAKAESEEGKLLEVLKNPKAWASSSG